MASWPNDLPAPLVDDYNEERQNQVLRTEMDAGPPQTRRRFTASIDKFSVSWVMTESQVSTLETFFEDTIGGGALSFDWTHPRKDTTVSARFTEPYTMDYLGAGYYKVSANLEVLP